jgi:AcrR family transcriptional regulator
VEVERLHRGNRYGRSEDARLSVLHAADDLLVEVGFVKLTIEGIAERAGVAKQTIYRWWPSKVAILLDALTVDAAEDLVPADTGDLAGELRSHLRRLARFLTTADAGKVLRALMAQAQHDPGLAERLRTEYLARQHERDRLPFERALHRGDLPAGTDIEAAVEELVAPLYYRALVTGQPLPPRYTDRLVTRVLERLPA